MWNSLPHAALKWTPPGKRRTVGEEMKMAGKTWIEPGWLAQDRAGWRVFPMYQPYSIRLLSNESILH